MENNFTEMQIKWAALEHYSYINAQKIEIVLKSHCASFENEDLDPLCRPTRTDVGYLPLDPGKMEFL